MPYLLLLAPAAQRTLAHTQFLAQLSDVHAGPQPLQRHLPERLRTPTFALLRHLQFYLSCNVSSF
jgi:hypothetical protein